MLKTPLPDDSLSIIKTSALSPRGHPWKLGTLEQQEALQVQSHSPRVWAMYQLLPPRINGWLWGGKSCQSASPREPLLAMRYIGVVAGGRGNIPPSQQIRQAVGAPGLATTGTWTGNQGYPSHPRPGGR